MRIVRTLSFPTVSYPAVSFRAVSFPAASFPAVSFPAVSFPVVSFPAVRFAAGLCAAVLFAAIAVSGCRGDSAGGADSSAQVKHDAVRAAAPANQIKSSGGGLWAVGKSAVRENAIAEAAPARASLARVSLAKGDGALAAAFAGKSRSGGPSEPGTAAQQDAPQDAPELQDDSFRYTILSAAALTPGVRVAVVRANISGSCVLPGRVAAFSPVASGEVTTPGSVLLRFKDARSSPFVEIIYIDRNDSGHLDTGDRIWGSNPRDPAGICFSPGMELVHRVDWDGVAAVIGGSATYAGDGLDFLASVAGESQLPVGSLIIGESGYENL